MIVVINLRRRVPPGAICVIRPLMKGRCMMFDSFSGFFFWVMIGVFFWLWAIGSAIKTTVNVTKEVLKDETVREVGKGVLASWLESLFKK